MRDKISIPRVQLLHPAVRAEVIAGIDKAEAGFNSRMAVRIVQGLRTIEEQNKLYAQGRTAPGPKVTNAKGGRSYHNYGTAFDFALMYDTDWNGTYETLSWDINKDGDLDGQKDWLEVVKIFVDMGWRWGADWDQDGLTKAMGDKDEHLVDSPHLEKRFGLTTQQMYDRYLAKSFIPGTQYIKL